MNTTPSEIGARIKKARKAARMSQTELGLHLKKTLRTIQKYESGEIEPSFATINEIADILQVSSAELMGYQRQDTHLSMLSDVINVLNELNKKTNLRFTIDVKRPPNSEGWTCSLTFNGYDPAAENNADLCLFLERYAEERERLETYWSDQEHFDRWFDQELSYYSGIKLSDKMPEYLTLEERLKRRDELINARLRETKKTVENDGQ